MSEPEGDREWMLYYRDELIPELQAEVERLNDTHNLFKLAIKSIAKERDIAQSHAADLAGALEQLMTVTDTGVLAIPTGRVRELVTGEIINARAALAACHEMQKVKPSNDS